MAAKQICRVSVLLAGLLLTGCGPSASVAPAPAPAAQNAPPPQTEGAFPFHGTRYYDPPYFNLKKLEISGKTDSSALSTANAVLIKEIKMDIYGLVTKDPAHVTNALEMIITAPECLLPSDWAQGGKELRGSSAGPLTMQTADGGFLITGTGYLLDPNDTNAALTISNNVSTTVKNDLLATNGAAESVSPATGGRFIHIHSDSFRSDLNANLITYRDHVHVEDEQLDLVCDVMNIQRSTNGPISELVADGHIVIVDKITGGRTTGDHAVYSDVAGEQLVTLTGNPYWQSGPREATAQAFVFDRTGRTFRAVGDAHFKLPASAMTGTGFVLAPQSAGTNAPGLATNLADVYAGAITLVLPATTNGPLQSVTAETNVVILDPDRNSRATADRADYSEADGTLVLSGKAQWESDQGTARGEVLTFNRNDLSFSAVTNAYLKFPTAALSESASFGNLAARNAATTNSFVEVTSDSYDYHGQALTFRDHVHAGFLEDDAIRGTLDSGKLTVGFRQTNALQSIVAEDNVQIQQPPTPTADGKTVMGDFNCSRIEVQFRTNNSLESAVATGPVQASRTETSAGSAVPLHLSLAAGGLNALFMPDTNAIQILVAETNVLMTRNEDKASGDKVVYTATNDTAVLTGHPRLELPNVHMTADDAIIYDRGRGQVFGRGNPQIGGPFTPGALSQAQHPAMPNTNFK